MVFKRLRDLREDADLTQAQVAEILNVHMVTYRRYENGSREVPAWVIVRLAETYHTSADYLLGLSNKK